MGKATTEICFNSHLDKNNHWKKCYVNMAIKRNTFIWSWFCAIAFRVTKITEKKATKPYTGIPKDYAQEFVDGVKQCNSRPKQMHSYAKSA